MDVYTDRPKVGDCIRISEENYYNDNNAYRYFIVEKVTTGYETGTCITLYKLEGREIIIINPYSSFKNSDCETKEHSELTLAPKNYDNMVKCSLKEPLLALERITNMKNIDFLYREKIEEIINSSSGQWLCINNKNWGNYELLVKVESVQKEIDYNNIKINCSNWIWFDKNSIEIKHNQNVDIFYLDIPEIIITKYSEEKALKIIENKYKTFLNF